MSEERTDALAKAFCLLDSFAGDGLGHVYGNGQTIDADDTVLELCAAFDCDPEPGWWRSLADELASPPAKPAPADGMGFQAGVQQWMLACFGAEITGDLLERADRFTEEALELAQTMPGFNAERAHALVDYVFSRPVGDRYQEVGGVMVTLAALCNPVGLDINEEAERELARIWTKVEAIRAKQAAKPTGSALPIALSTAQGEGA